METVKISELQTVQEITGKEYIPVEYGGKNYKITPEQIAPFVKIENLQTFDSITGAEKVIVVKDGQAQGLVTLTQIRQVVLPGYTYEDLSFDAFPVLRGGISNTGFFDTHENNTRFEIPIPIKNCVFVISLISVSTGKPKLAFGFSKSSISELQNGNPIPFVDNIFYTLSVGETITIKAPDDASYLIINNTYNNAGALNRANWSIQIGELLEDKVEELSARVNLLEQSAVAPAALDSVSREEFDALRNEIEKLKSN